MPCSQSYRSSRHLQSCSIYARALIRQYYSNSEPCGTRNLSSWLDVGNHARSRHRSNSGIFGGRCNLLDVRRHLWASGQTTQRIVDDRTNLLKVCLCLVFEAASCSLVCIQKILRSGMLQRVLGLHSLRRNIATSRPQRATKNVGEDVSAVTKTKGPPSSARYVRGSVSEPLSIVLLWSTCLTALS